MTTRLSVLASVLVSVMTANTTGLAAENWPGFEGGGPHHNASARSIDPATLAVRWRTELSPYYRFDCDYLSRNLALMGGRLAVAGTPAALATDDWAEKTKKEALLPITLLDAATGEADACFTTNQWQQSHGQHTWPTSLYIDARDVGLNMTMLLWEPHTGVLFLKSAGDNTTNTTYLPPAPGGGAEPRPGRPAFEPLMRAHPNVADRLGKTRGDYAMHTGPRRGQPLGPSEWLMMGQNVSAFVANDPDRPLLAGTFMRGHQQAGPFRVINPAPGLVMADSGESPGWRVAGTQAAATETDNQLLPFAKWDGVILDGGCIYILGPGQDCDDSGSLGNTKFHGTARWRTGPVEQPDQGLAVACYRAEAADLQPNDGATGAAALDTVRLTPLWARILHSAHRPTRGPHDTESYLETDGLERNKAWLVLDGRAWAAWKPSKAGPVQLVRADGEGIATWDLGVGQGLTGWELRPLQALARSGERRLFAYAHNVNQYREFLEVTPPYWPIWSAHLQPPRGPAALAVFDLDAGRLAYTDNLTERFASLRPDWHFGPLGQLQMVATGDRIWLGWIDLSEDEAALQLACYGATDAAPAPVVRRFCLGFASRDYRDSELTELIAADGSLYALVTRAKVLNPQSINGATQFVVALSGG